MPTPSCARGATSSWRRPTPRSSSSCARCTAGIGRLTAVIDQVKAAGSTIIPGEDAFTLKDTYGFPLDLTQKSPSEQG